LNGKVNGFVSEKSELVGRKRGKVGVTEEDKLKIGV